jgi:hypothetical protein
MLDWSVVRRTKAAAISAATVTAALVLASGCRPNTSGGSERKDKQSAASPSPTPSGTPTPFPLKVTASGVDTTLFDEKGRRIAEVRAAKVAAGPGSPGKSGVDPVGTVLQGTATLYQEGRPAASFAADTLRADRETRTVVGTGNVRLRSLRADVPAIRADRMTWLHDKNQITGTGNVLITRAPDLKIPGERFEADTEVRRFKVYTGGAPATGTF